MEQVRARRDDTLVARITEVHPLPGVRAGSALLLIGGRLLAVQDDAFAAVWIDPVTRVTQPLVLRGEGDELSKHEKPDFEAAFTHDDRIWILGSGSRPNRCNIARIDFSRREAPLFNALPLYGAVARAVGQPANIEGAVALSDRLRPFQRGPGRTPAGSFTVDVPLDVLAAAPPRVLAATNYDLGMLDGVHLAFSDAVTLGRGHIVYLAVAEDTPDGIADGPLAGAAIGLIRDGTARWNQVVEADGTPSRRKIEGLALDAHGGGWLLTDPDDASRPAELCSVQIRF